MNVRRLLTWVAAIAVLMVLGRGRAAQASQGQTGGRPVSMLAMMETHQTRQTNIDNIKKKFDELEQQAGQIGNVSVGSGYPGVELLGERHALVTSLAAAMQALGDNDPDVAQIKNIQDQMAGPSKKFSDADKEVRRLESVARSSRSTAETSAGIVADCKERIQQLEGLIRSESQKDAPDQAALARWRAELREKEAEQQKHELRQREATTRADQAQAALPDAQSRRDQARATLDPLERQLDSAMDSAMKKYEEELKKWTW